MAASINDSSNETLVSMENQMGGMPSMGVPVMMPGMGSAMTPGMMAGGMMPGMGGAMTPGMMTGGMMPGMGGAMAPGMMAGGVGTGIGAGMMSGAVGGMAGGMAGDGIAGGVGSGIMPAMTGGVMPMMTPGMGNVMTPGMGGVMTPGMGGVMTPGMGGVMTPGMGGVMTPGMGGVMTPGMGGVMTPGMISGGILNGMGGGMTPTMSPGIMGDGMVGGMMPDSMDSGTSVFATKYNIKGMVAAVTAAKNIAQTNAAMVNNNNKQMAGPTSPQPFTNPFVMDAALVNPPMGVTSKKSKKRDPSTLSGDSQSKDAANPETKPQTAKKTEIESNIESRIEPRIESKIESKIEPKIESKIESTIESTIESKTNVRPAWSKTDQVSSLALPSKPEPEPEPETDLGIDIEVDNDALSGQMSAWRNEILGKGGRVHAGGSREGGNLHIKGLPDYAFKKIEDRRSLAKSMNIFRLTRENIVKLWIKFRQFDEKKKGRMYLQQFHNLIKTPSNAYTQTLFQLIDAKHAAEALVQKDEVAKLGNEQWKPPTISFAEYVKAVATYCLFGNEDILKFCFFIFDKDHNGVIDKAEIVELAHIVHATASGHSNPDKSLGKIVDKFSPTSRVVVKDLVNDPEYNGKTAKVLDYDNTDDTYRVKLDLLAKSTGQEVILNLAAKNVEPLIQASKEDSAAELMEDLGFANTSRAMELTYNKKIQALQTQIVKAVDNNEFELSLKLKHQQDHLKLLADGGVDLSGFRLLNKQYPQVLMPASLLKHNLAATTGLGGYFWDLQRAKMKKADAEEVRNIRKRMIEAEKEAKREEQAKLDEIRRRKESVLLARIGPMNYLCCWCRRKHDLKEITHEEIFPKAQEFQTTEEDKANIISEGHGRFKPETYGAKEAAATKKAVEKAANKDEKRRELRSKRNKDRNISGVPRRGYVDQRVAPELLGKGLRTKEKANAWWYERGHEIVRLRDVS